MPELIEKLDKEGFTGVETFEELKENFDEPTSKNPLQNMEPVKDNTEKKPAAPSFNPIIDDLVIVKDYLGNAYLPLGWI